MKQHTKYRDLDEIKSSPAAERKLPWWKSHEVEGKCYGQG